LWIDVLEMVAIVIGVFFMFVASVGVLRLRDFYLRVHAPTKAATLGLAFLLIAVALNVQEKTVVTKAALALLFLGATAPVGAHILARAAYRNGVPALAGCEVDEYAHLVDQRRTDPYHVEPEHARDVEAEHHG
jgi:multicomponent Na+:H+ antiporter subunit G